MTLRGDTYTAFHDTINRHRSAVTFFRRWDHRGMGGPTFLDLLRGALRGLLVNRVVIMCEFERRFLLPARVHFNFMPGARRRGRGGREGKGCLLQREESFIGDYGTPRRAAGLPKRDFIPPLSEGNKCRGTFDQPTDVSRRPASDSTGDFVAKFAFPEMITELYYRIMLETAARELGSR